MSGSSAPSTITRLFDGFYYTLFPGDKVHIEPSVKGHDVIKIIVFLYENKIKILLFNIILLFYISFKLFKKTKQISNIPGTNGLPLLGETFNLINENQHGFCKNRFKKYKSNYFFSNILGKKTIFIQGMDFIKQLEQVDKIKLQSEWTPNFKMLFGDSSILMLTNDKHKFIRNIISETFNDNFFENYINTLNLQNKSLINTIIHLSRVDGKFDLYKITRKSIFDINSRIILGNKYPTNNYEKLYKLYEEYGKGFLVLPINNSYFQFGKSINAVKEIRQLIIDEYSLRIKKYYENNNNNNNNNNNSLNVSLNQSLDSLDDCNDLLDGFIYNFMDKNKNIYNFNEISLSENLATIIFATLDTSVGAYLTSFISLTKYKNTITKKLKNELYTFLKKYNKKNLSYDDIKNCKIKLPYLYAFVLECLRYSSPAANLQRVAADDIILYDKINNSSFKINKGEGVWICLSNTLQYNSEIGDKDLYPQNKFIPERFLDSKLKIREFKVFGFNGISYCPGNQFERYQLISITANFLISLDIDKLTINEVELVMDPTPKPKSNEKLIGFYKQ